MLGRNCMKSPCHSDATGHCPLCDGPKFPQIPAVPFQTGYGCVCPPGANMTCKNPLCPRGGDGRPLNPTC